MKGIFIAIAVFLGASTCANAEVFKCTSADAMVSFSPSPCHPSQGVAEYQRGALPADDPYDSQALQRNNRAARILQYDNRGSTRVTVVPDSSRPVARERRRSTTVVKNCYSYGSRNQFTNCQDSNGGTSQSVTHGHITRETYFPGNREP